MNGDDQVTDPQAPAVVVTEAARKAAADLERKVIYALYGDLGERVAQVTETGGRDGTITVRAFAAFEEQTRLATQSSMQARIEELEAELARIVERSHNDPLGTSKVIDMREIARATLSNIGAAMMDDLAPSLLQRDPLALAMFAAWVNLPSDKLPPEMRAHTCEQTAKAWERVATAVRSYLLSEERVEAAAVGAVPEPTHLYNQGTRGTQYEADMKRAVAVERAVFIGRYRAALSSAIGQPEAEFSGWVEVVEDGE